MTTLGTTATHVYSREQLRPWSIRLVSLSVTSNRCISGRATRTLGWSAVMLKMTTLGTTVTHVYSREQLRPW